MVLWCLAPLLLSARCSWSEDVSRAWPTGHQGREVSTAMAYVTRSDSTRIDSTRRGEIVGESRPLTGDLWPGLAVPDTVGGRSALNGVGLGLGLGWDVSGTGRWVPYRWDVVRCLGLSGPQRQLL